MFKAQAVFVRQIVYHAKPSCNYAGQQYEAGENEYPLNSYFLVLYIQLHHFYENDACFLEYLPVLPIVCK